jgi:hypothetical protein
MLRLVRVFTQSLVFVILGFVPILFRVAAAGVAWRVAQLVVPLSTWL